MVDLEFLIESQKPPSPFTPGDKSFWDDPYISAQLLKAHLDPNTDIASRKHDTIKKSVDWIITSLDLNVGDQVLDLGCGPGLYASLFARQGMKVTGIDLSPRSIDYARKEAEVNHFEINYRCENYLELKDRGLYDAVLLIFGDFCTFNKDQRQRILSNVHRALKPGGRFVLDVSTWEHRKKHGLQNNWYASEGGFWRPGLHLVLEQGFDYPADQIYLDQYNIIEAECEPCIYRNWFQDYDPTRINRELVSAGFMVIGLWNDLCGSTLTDHTEWIGVIAEKV